MIHSLTLPVLIGGRSGISMMSEEVAREYNIGWTHAGSSMINPDDNWCYLRKVAESVPINAHVIVLPVSNFLAKSESEQVFLGSPSESNPGMCKRNLDDGSCEITISAVNGSERVMSVTTCPGDKRDRFASRSGNLSAELMSVQLGRIGPGATEERGWRVLGGKMGMKMARMVDKEMRCSRLIGRGHLQ